MTPMTATTTLASTGTNFTPIGVVLAIFVPVCAAVAVIVWNYFRLQRHRADAVAMASYRKLAEEAVASMTDLRAEMAKLAEHVSRGCAPGGPTRPSGGTSPICSG